MLNSNNNNKYTVVLTISNHFANKYGLDLKYVGKKIVVYHNRFSHFIKHKSDYINTNSYRYSIRKMNSIIYRPDFITYNNKNKSLNFVKKLKDNTLIAVKIQNKNFLKIVTIFPINSIKYNRLKNNRLK